MFKRSYFMKIKKYAEDGLSYSYVSSTPTYKSFFPKPLLVYNETIKHLVNELRHRPGNKIEVMSFNRI